MARRAVAATMLAGACVGLAACTGEPEPIVTESPTAVASPVATPSTTPSPSATAISDDELLAMMPEGAERADVYGAMMTATFFLEQYAPMFHTGDTRIWEALSADGCEYCADALANAERVRDEGWTARGGEITVDSELTQAALSSDSDATVVLESRVGDAYLVSSSGVEEQTGESRRVTYAFSLTLSDSRWLVRAVASES